MTLSVAMATYNGQRFLPEQLASLAAQTMLPAELVVSDDGSSDDTRAVIEAFGRTAPFRVRLLPPHERLGFADNFLHAVENCRSPLVALADQDDVWLPHKLAAAQARLAADDSLLTLHRLTMTDEELRPTGSLDQGIAGDACFAPLELDPYVTGWGNTMLFRRELASLIPRGERPRQPEDTRPLSHDTWLYVLAAALGRVSHIAEPLILYRQHAANVYGTVGSGGVAERLRHRLDMARTVPITTYRERAIFDAHMARLLAGFAADADERWQAAARRAADRFDERARRRAHRVRLYDGASKRSRLVLYTQMLRTRVQSTEAASARRRAIVKDLVLGVTGLGRRL